MSSHTSVPGRIGRQFFRRPAAWIVNVVMILIAVSYGSAQELDVKLSDQITAIVQKRIAKAHLAGVAVCVVEKGKTQYCEAFGYAELDGKRELTCDTPFQIASLSKQFAATSIMILVREGRISLEDPIGNYLQDLPENWNKITVTQLLSHTSGIKDYAKFPNIKIDYQKDLDRDEMRKRLYAHPLDFQPGEKFNYSNSGYNIVGFLVESVTGKDYGDYLNEQIFEPLEMKSTRLEPVQNDDPLRAIGYDYRNKKHTTATYNSPAWAFAAGGIVSSINDLAKWDAAIDQNKILTKKEQKRVWTVQRINGKSTEYGLGWMLKPGPGGKHFALHLGGKPGFSAAMARLVEDRLTIIVLSNRTEGQASGILDEIGKMLLSARKK